MTYYTKLSVSNRGAQMGVLSQSSMSDKGLPIKYVRSEDRRVGMLKNVGLVNVIIVTILVVQISSTS